MELVRGEVVQRADVWKVADIWIGPFGELIPDRFDDLAERRLQLEWLVDPSREGLQECLDVAVLAVAELRELGGEPDEVRGERVRQPVLGRIAPIGKFSRGSTSLVQSLSVTVRDIPEHWPRRGS